MSSGLRHLFIVLMVLVLLPRAYAAQSSRVVVLLVDGLAYSDVRSLKIDDSVNRDSAGLMSVGLAQGANPVSNVYASLGAGDTIHVGDVSEGRLCEALHAAAKRVGVVDDGAVEGTVLIHLIPKPDDILTFGNGRGMRPEWTTQSVGAFGRDDLIVVHVADKADLAGTLWTVQLVVRHFKVPARLFVVGATPPPSWDRLTPVIIEDIGSPNPVSGSLTSTTTHTPGLIASRDIAPSILDYLHVPIPIQMTGAPIESRLMTPADVDRTLDHLDRVTHLNQQAQNPFFWGLGLVGGIVIFACVGLTIRGKPVGNPAVLYLLRVLSSWPLALLVVWGFDPHTMPAYLGWIGAVCLVVALLPSPAVIFWVTSVVVVVDAFFGSRLVAQTVLSAYWMSGIRFYGIGNEYMGVMIGGALMTPIVFATAFGTLTSNSGGTGLAGRPPTTMNVIAEPASSNRPSRAEGTRASHAMLAIYFALTVFVLSFPAFGAKAGGAVTASATFLFLWWELRGRKITPLMSIGAVAIGFGLVIAWAVLGHVLHLTPTHIDTAVGAASSGRFGYILGVAERKVGLALKVAVHPGTIAGVVALIVLIAGTRTLMRDKLQSLWERRPDYRAVVMAGIRGCVVALLFNDSGIVAAILLIISLMLPVLYNIFEETATHPASFLGTPHKTGGGGVSNPSSGAVEDA